MEKYSLNLFMDESSGYENVSREIHGLGDKLKEAGYDVAYFNNSGPCALWIWESAGLLVEFIGLSDVRRNLESLLGITSSNKT